MVVVIVRRLENLPEVFATIRLVRNNDPLHALRMQTAKGDSSPARDKDICLVFVSGEFPVFERIRDILPHTGMIVAADGGYDVASGLGIEVDVLLGDMDSIRRVPENARTKVERFSREKDFTDTELAFDYASKQGFERIFLVGGGGGRLDHLLAIWNLLKRKPHPERWYTANDEVIVIPEHLEISVVKGRTISFFPLSDEPVRAKTKGLRWNLDGLSWKQSDFGVSNETTGAMLEVKLLQGRLAMVRSLDPGEPGLDVSIAPF